MRAECVEFLQWCLPRLRMRWPGFRKVRSQVCKRLGRRIRELGLEDYEAYRTYLETHAEEWSRLDGMCRITISRFFRDRAVFEALEAAVLPEIVSALRDRGDNTLRIWSCGCASGEEVYATVVLWEARLANRYPGVDLEAIATDADPHMLERARRGLYDAGSVRELPADLRQCAFEGAGEPLQIRDSLRQRVSWRCQDVREATPQGPFELILCRNLVFTYFDEALQLDVIRRVVEVLRSGGALVIGSHESLPPHDLGFVPWSERLPIYRLAE